MQKKKVNRRIGINSTLSIEIFTIRCSYIVCMKIQQYTKRLEISKKKKEEKRKERRKERREGGRKEGLVVIL